MKLVIYVYEAIVLTLLLQFNLNFPAEYNKQLNTSLDKSFKEIS